MEAVNPDLTGGQVDRWAVGEPPSLQTVKPSSQEPLRLLEIERELAGPNREEAFARYDAVLAGVDRRLAAALRAGLPPDEFPRAEALKEANALARKILRLTVRVDGQAQRPSGQTFNNTRKGS